MNGDTIYLDNAATSFPKPAVVLDAVDYYGRKIGSTYGRNNSRGTVETNSVFDETRAAVAKLIGAADRNHICFTYNCTDSLNIALNGILKPGDSAVSTVMEHNAVLRPLFHLKKKLGLKVTLLEPAEDGRIQPHLVRRHLTAETRVVVITAMSNVVGTPQPVREIGEVVKEYSDAALIVDGAQAVGHIPIDVIKDRVDLLCFSAHKALMGSQGLGIIYVSPDVALEPYRLGGTAFSPSYLHVPEQYPELIEAGTPNIPGVWALRAALRFADERARTGESVGKRIQANSVLLLRELRKLKNFTVHVPGSLDEICGPFCITCTGLSPGDLDMILNETYGIVVRTGLHCAPLMHQWMGTSRTGATRLSPGFFTSEEELDRTIRALHDISKSV